MLAIHTGFMIDETHIKKLAELGRISVSSEEVLALRSDIASILSYVEQIQEVSSDVDLRDGENTLKNVMREDGDPHEGGIYSNEILKLAPIVRDDFVVVKKIIEQE